MAQYKVPQNVEAEDKLLGPLTFRQFIYMLIALGAAALAYFLGSMIALPLAIIPLPVFFFFGLLALPLRKDQPMEVYLAAVVKFWFKPHLRLWDAEGNDDMITIDVPVADDAPKTKEFGSEEAVQRLSFLADLEDTQGWSVRGLEGSPHNKNLDDNFVMAAEQAPDILDDSDSLSQSLDEKIHETEERSKQAAMAQIQNEAIKRPAVSVINDSVFQRTSGAPKPAVSAEVAAEISESLKKLQTAPASQFGKIIQPIQDGATATSAAPIISPTTAPVTTDSTTPTAIPTDSTATSTTTAATTSDDATDDQTAVQDNTAAATTTDGQTPEPAGEKPVIMESGNANSTAGEVEHSVNLGDSNDDGEVEINLH